MTELRVKRELVDNNGEKEGVDDVRALSVAGADFVAHALARADNVTDSEASRGDRVPPPPTDAVTEKLLRGVAVGEPPPRVIVPCNEREIEALREWLGEGDCDRVTAPVRDNDGDVDVVPDIDGDRDALRVALDDTVRRPERDVDGDTLGEEDDEGDMESPATEAVAAPTVAVAPDSEDAADGDVECDDDDELDETPVAEARGVADPESDAAFEKVESAPESVVLAL